jgi:hypothetical protein
MIIVELPSFSNELLVDISGTFTVSQPSHFRPTSFSGRRRLKACYPFLQFSTRSCCVVLLHLYPISSRRASHESPLSGLFKTENYRHQPSTFCISRSRSMYSILCVLGLRLPNGQTRPTAGAEKMISAATGTCQCVAQTT